MRFDREEDKSLASPRTALIGACAPNARFYRRAALQKIGPFSLDYRYFSDRDWLARWYEAGLRMKPIAESVYRYRRHSGSLTFAVERSEKAIRAELVKLARRWESDPHASMEMRHTARLLEGRCLFYLARKALLERDLNQALKWLCEREQRISGAPAAFIMLGAIDWVVQYVRNSRDYRQPRG
jgi:hypothetical protein